MQRLRCCRMCLNQRSLHAVHGCDLLLPPPHRRRCRQFPALINCCTIDWYAPWPEEALTSVATSLLASADLGGSSSSSSSPAGTDSSAKASTAAAGSSQASHGQLVAKVAAMCVHVHTSVEAAAERMYQELRRRWAAGRAAAGQLPPATFLLLPTIDVHIVVAVVAAPAWLSP
jgi:hypothetical protein